MRLTGGCEIGNRTAEPYRRSTAAETRGKQRPTDGGDWMPKNIEWRDRSDLESVTVRCLSPAFGVRIIPSRENQKREFNAVSELAF
ncbi:hypothetical protein PS1_024175 [Malus domestica]